ncbi:MAG TPA: MBL fold metallo-hydrolase [Candidatus Acidoferrales bacterium]|nr:MBL fold metallo-hydrolase [Candidatus Acidoferrales bacterium]
MKQLRLRQPLRRFAEVPWLVAAVAVMLGVLAPPVSHAGPARKAQELMICFVDVEGGQATLFVTPEGHSLLIDTGWPLNNGRDADRIAAAAKEMGISRIDFLLLTHYHADHAGGVPQLAEKMPIGTVFDHGENREESDAVTVQVWKDYQAFVAKGTAKRITPKPGDVLPIPDMKVTVISADGATITQPLGGAGGENAACAESGPYPVDNTENPRSLGTLIQFGKLRVLDLGDLTSEKEMLVMCPKNLIGKVDILIVSHHGTLTSSSPALVYGVAPRVAIMDNGAIKGGSPGVWDTIEKSPGLEDLWQLHFAAATGAHNVSDAFIANLAGVDGGHYLRVAARKDGSFEVYNARTNETKKYAAP